MRILCAQRKMKAYGAGGFMRMFFGCPAGARKTRHSKYYGSASFHSKKSPPLA
jgi:hypothetical protein